MLNDYLPIGSVVLLKGARRRLMVTGYDMYDKKNPNMKYDYCGCTFPEGVVDTNVTILFNHNQIERIFFVGLQDVEQQRYVTSLKNYKENNAGDGGNTNKEVVNDSTSNKDNNAELKEVKPLDANGNAIANQQ